ncbi:MAG: hypothetical protein KFW07_04005, partial [Mycoplasmataceae bacterium]|nr:hypothetical protein [Mycoplasmataceae bacterium]
GNVLIYKFNEWEPLDDSAANNLKKYFNSRDDLSWISGINNFVNPISGVYKIVNPKVDFFYKNDIFSPNSINFFDHNVSLNQEAKITKNHYKEKNHFIANENSLLFSVFKIKGNIGGPLNEDLYVSFNNSILNTLSSDNNENIYRQFDKTLKSIEKLPYDINKPETLTSIKKLIITDLDQSLKVVFDKIYSAVNEKGWKTVLTLDNETHGPVDVVDVDRKSFEDEVKIFLFYTYGLNKINNDYNKFNNKELFFDSVKNNNINLFLGSNFKLNEAHKDQNGGLLIKSFDQNLQYNVFINNGEKIPALAVSASWTIINILILSVAVIIYYKRDFV